MADEGRSGIDSISKPVPTGNNLALPRLIRGEDGFMHTIYVDARTGQRLQTLDGYEVLDGGNNYYNPDGTPANDSSNVSDVPDRGNRDDGEGRFGRGDGESDKSRISDKVSSEKNSASNNFGYTDKPGWLAAAGMIPGAPGMIGKAANIAVNTSHRKSTDDAREMIGLDRKGSLKDIVKDNKGHVADVNINDKNYSVGLSGLSPKGNTNLTPTEANNRKNQLGGMTETATRTTGPDGKESGFFSKFLDKVTGGKVGKNGSLAEKTTGLKDGWLGRALDEALGIERNPPTPTAANRPTTSPTTLSPADKNGNRQVTGPGGGSMGFVGMPNRPAGGQINYEHTNTRGEWNNHLNPEIQDVAQRISGTLDGMDMTSAYRSPAVNKAVGGAPNSAHTHGEAFDFSTRGMTDEQKQKAVEMSRLSGANRVGTYKDGSIHVDSREGYDPNTPVGGIRTVDGVYGMYDRTGVNAAKNAPDWFTRGMTEDRFAPTPTARPETLGAPIDRGIQRSTLDPIGDTLDPTKTGSVFDALQPADSYAKSITQNNVQATTKGDKFSGIDLSSSTPAQMASLGMVQRTPEQRDLMSRAIAGELSGDTLRELQAGNPTARTELANIATTMENRAASSKFGSMDKALDPSQYNSLAKNALGVTNNNFDKYGGLINNNLNDFYANKLTPSSFDLTSYHNPDLSNPDWSKKMTNPQVVGDHKFGSLNGPYDYGPGSDFKKERDRLSKAQITDTRGWTPDTSKPATSRPSAHDVEREVDRSLGGGRSVGSGSVTSGKSSPSAHSQERERDTSLGSSKSLGGTSKGVGNSKSPTNDGGGGKKSPGGGF